MELITPKTITYNNRKIVFEYKNKSHYFPIYTLGGREVDSLLLKTITIKHTVDGSEQIAPNGIYTFHYDTDTYKFTKTEFLNKISRSGYKDIDISYINIDKIEDGVQDGGEVDEVFFSVKAPVHFHLTKLNTIHSYLWGM